MNLNSQRELDWLQFSRFTSTGPESLLAFQSIIQGRTITQPMFQKLPKGYLAKLLKTFRNELSSYHRNSALIQQIMAVKQQQKSQLLHKAQILQTSLTHSKAKLNSQQHQLKVKAEVLRVLIAKIKKKQKSLKTKQPTKQEPVTRYYCPFCKIEDFSNRSLFEAHVLQAHQPQKEDSAVQNFILELKDKELAMMEMVMKRNDDLNQAHRTLMEREMLARTKQFQGSLGNPELTDDSELMGESEYIWFKKENESENVPRNNTQQFPPQIMLHQPPLITQMNIPQQYCTSQQYHTSHPINKSSGWKPKPPTTVDPSPQPYTSIKPLSFLNQYSSKQQYSSRPSKLNSSIYKNQQPSILEGGGGGFAYNSGPLVDDESDSEIDDYFNVPGGMRKGARLVVDQEIVIDERLLSKWGSSIMDDKSPKKENSEERIRLPSQLLSAEEDSVLDRDFSLSKDSSDINLSDLRYSKLVKRQQLHKENTERIEKEEIPLEQKKPETTRPRKLQTVLFTVPQTNELINTKQSELLKQFLSGTAQLPKLQKTDKTINNSSKDFSKKPSPSINILEEFFIQPQPPSQLSRQRSTSKTQKPCETQPEPPRKHRRTEQLNDPPPKGAKFQRPPAPSSSSEPIQPIQPLAPASTPPPPNILPFSLHQDAPEDSHHYTDRYILRQLQDLTLIKQQQIQQTLINNSDN